MRTWFDIRIAHMFAAMAEFFYDCSQWCHTHCIVTYGRIARRYKAKLDQLNQ